MILLQVHAIFTFRCFGTMASSIPTRSFYKRTNLHTVIPGSSADSDGSDSGNEDLATLPPRADDAVLMTTNTFRLRVMLLLRMKSPPRLRQTMSRPQGKEQLPGIGSVPRLLHSNVILRRMSPFLHQMKLVLLCSISRDYLMKTSFR